MTPLATYLLGAILAWSPLSAHRYTGASDEQTFARYESIAEDLADVTSEELPAFAGPDGTVKTALLALSIASLESGGFRADVDSTKPSGDCHGGHCHAVCVAQIWLRPGERVENRRDCFRLELARIRESLATCRTLPLSQRLAVYASGSCSSPHGRRASERRVDRATQYLAGHPWNGDGT